MAARTKRAAPAHDVFISYSMRDRARADAVCAALERDGLRCWIAPRDGTPGASYARFLVEAIAASRLVVLLFSRAANRSEAVLNELELAASRGVPVLPLRLENVQPAGAAEFYLRRRHWLDVYDGFDSQLATLPAAVRDALAPPARSRTRASAPAAATPPTNLPRPATTFVGRAADLARIGALLQTLPLVTIVGTGGVGKTRLALEAARAVDAPADGVWFVDFAPLAGEGLVAGTILSVLGVAQQAERDAAEQLVAHLHARHALLVLDNCEHVVAEVARIAAAITQRCPHVRLLATSREPLGVAGEETYRLATLDVAEASRLFAERAHAANQAFTLTEANRALVEHICERLDGIALAIELAAARLRVISIDELARRLQERFRILTGGSRTALPHQQTMRALIDWSYDVLSEGEQTLFRRLGAFSGGCTLEAVERVCCDDGDAWDALEGLSSLVDKSLVVAEVDDARQRYRLLQSLHDYARERLTSSGESALLAQRHAEYVAASATSSYEEWDSSPRADWLPRQRADLDNLRAALTWTLRDGKDVALGARIAANALPSFLRLSLLAEGIAWGVRAADVADLPVALAARLHYGLAMLYTNQVAPERGLAAAQRAVTFAEQSDDDRALTRALSQLAWQYGRQSRHDEALVQARRALERARHAGDARLLAATLQRCAMVLRPDEIDQARMQFSECVALFRSLGRDDETSRALMWWGAAESHAGCFDRAIDVWQEALELGDADSRMHLTNNIASCALALDDADRAAPAAREACSLAARLRHPGLLANAIASLASVAREGDPARAARLFGYAQGRRSELGWQGDNTDAAISARLTSALRGALGDARMQALCTEGAAWSEDRALREAAQV